MKKKILSVTIQHHGNECLKQELTAPEAGTCSTSNRLLYTKENSELLSPSKSNQLTDSGGELWRKLTGSVE